MVVWLRHGILDRGFNAEGAEEKQETEGRNVRNGCSFGWIVDSYKLAGERSML